MFQVLYLIVLYMYSHMNMALVMAQDTRLRGNVSGL